MSVCQGEAPRGNRSLQAPTRQARGSSHIGHRFLSRSAHAERTARRPSAKIFHVMAAGNVGRGCRRRDQASALTGGACSPSRRALRCQVCLRATTPPPRAIAGSARPPPAHSHRRRVSSARVLRGDSLSDAPCDKWTSAHLPAIPAIIPIVLVTTRPSLVGGVSNNSPIRAPLGSSAACKEGSRRRAPCQLSPAEHRPWHLVPDRVALCTS